MAKKRKYVVRIVLFKKADAAKDDPLALRWERGMGSFLECLRYAGVVTIHVNDENHMTFDLHCPSPTYDSQVWARHNAERMGGFGINAVVAPEWVNTSTEPKPT